MTSQPAGRCISGRNEPCSSAASEHPRGWLLSSVTIDCLYGAVDPAIYAAKSWNKNSEQAHLTIARLQMVHSAVYAAHFRPAAVDDCFMTGRIPSLRPITNDAIPVLQI